MKSVGVLWKEASWREENIQVKNSRAESSCLKCYEEVIKKAANDYADNSFNMHGGDGCLGLIQYSQEIPNPLERRLQKGKVSHSL